MKQESESFHHRVPREIQRKIKAFQIIHIHSTYICVGVCLRGCVFAWVCVMCVCVCVCVCVVVQVPDYVFSE